MEFLLINAVESSETKIPQDYIEGKINLFRTVRGVTKTGAIKTVIAYEGKHFIIMPFSAKRHACFEVTASNFVDEKSFKDTEHYRALIGSLVQSMLTKSANDITLPRIVLNQ
jgi:hypothetical protein